MNPAVYTAQNNYLFSMAVIIFTIALVLIFRIVMSYYIAKRGNMIVSAKGIDPRDVHMFSLAMFMSVVFGVLFGYIFVFWFSSAFPSNEEKHKIVPYVEENEAEE
ncbi:hypothetical protein [Butyrivibrio sp. AE2015]|uniref:hypothetical protein n=1 Tax=Butyrivibrio sp. AE2015 TaxID=1280663 RepID=UPI0003B4B348|nr:hypothetical protein [Butyrivibrio sp. AE2015]